MSATCRTILLIAAASMLSAGSAQAAVLTVVIGDAYVDAGKGFKFVDVPRKTVYPGNVISIGPKGRATLVYDNGCAFTIHPKRPITVAEPAPPCAGARTTGSVNSKYDVIIGTTTMSAAFGTIIYQATRSHKPSSP